MSPHGPSAEAYDKASAATLAPQKLDHTMAFMFESFMRILPTPEAMASPLLQDDYADCWDGLTSHFKTSE